MTTVFPFHFEILVLGKNQDLDPVSLGMPKLNQDGTDKVSKSHSLAGRNSPKQIWPQNAVVATAYMHASRGLDMSKSDSIILNISNDTDGLSSWNEELVQRFSVPRIICFNQRELGNALLCWMCQECKPDNLFEIVWPATDPTIEAAYKQRTSSETDMMKSQEILCWLQKERKSFTT